jgi:carbonic anhydrase
VRDWLARAADQPECSDPADPTVTEAVQNHALTQVLRLRSYPCVERRLAEGRLGLRAWFYEVHTGTVLEHRADTDFFEKL